MNQLLKSCIRKYVKNRGFWIAVCASFVLGLLFGREARRLYFNTQYIFFEFVFMAVLFTWMIGREYEDGIFRNKIIAGHSRGKIFLAEVVIGTAAGVMMFVACGIGFCLYNRYIFWIVPLNILLRIAGNVLLVNLGMIILYITIHCTVSHKVLSFLLCILILFGIAMGSSRLDSVLRIPEYEEVWEMVEIVDENGNKQTELQHTNTVRNPNYINGTARIFCDTLYQVLPWTNLNHSVRIIFGCFGYEDLEYLYKQHLNKNEMISNNEGTVCFSMTEEEENALNSVWKYSIGFIFTVSSIGYILFSRKEFQ